VILQAIESLVNDRFQQAKPLHPFVHYSPSAAMLPVGDLGCQQPLAHHSLWLSAKPD
jgi:hypothetical protein